MRNKVAIKEKAQRLTGMTGGFCNEYLDEDYKQLCENIIQKMSRKRNVPFLSGKLEIWAAAIVYALGQINFLFDNSFKPYASADDICDYFGTSKSTTGQKAKLIRDMFKMRYYDDEFSTIRTKENNPFSDLVMVNGFIVSMNSLPPEMQEAVRRKG